MSSRRQRSRKRPCLQDKFQHGARECDCLGCRPHSKSDRRQFLECSSRWQRGVRVGLLGICIPLQLPWLGFLRPFCAAVRKMSRIHGSNSFARLFAPLFHVHNFNTDLSAEKRYLAAIAASRFINMPTSSACDVTWPSSGEK